MTPILPAGVWDLDTKERVEETAAFNWLEANERNPHPAVRAAREWLGDEWRRDVRRLYEDLAQVPLSPSDEKREQRKLRRRLFLLVRFNL